MLHVKCVSHAPHGMACSVQLCSKKSVTQCAGLGWRGGGVANRGPDSWDIWAPGWSCSHQHSDWIREKEIPGITLNLLPFSSFLALLRVNPRGLVSKEAFEGEGP